jgi:hypothetical protein
MYDNLQRDILGLNNSEIVLGGDFNATWDTSNVDNNLDVLNMVNIPSVRRSNRIHEMCAVLNLTDPYRILYPNTREYTFTPMGENQHNRSRLDFFLITKNLCSDVVNVTIPHSLSSTVFDHKRVNLTFAKRKGKFNYFVKDNFINQEEFNASVHIAVVECYVIHATINENFTEGQKEVILGQIGLVTQNLAEINRLKIREVQEGLTPMLSLEIEGKRGEIRMNLDNLPSLEMLNTLELVPSPAVFFETLILCVKNNALLEQKRIYNNKNIKMSGLISRIKALKNVPFHERNHLELENAERSLNAYVERELKIELENYRRFETLNSEKITPHFMAMVKSSNKGESLTMIKKDDGTVLESLNDLKEHVGKYYKNIYKKNDTARNVLEIDSIESFLGEDVLNKTEVRNSKLTEEEKLDLDQPLTLEELTQSINNANLTSAPGSNGISNKFIKRYWDFFKNALLKYANYAFENGMLTDSFRTADIKLIPKKGGDLTKIKNWRPISLLNCFYKCISRAFAARLKKYMNKMTPCAQKGYANSRYCQEVLISVIETIEKCKSRKVKGAMLCLDIQKAFDSLSHSYLQKVFSFFNFGPNLIRWLTILSTRRAARIIIDNEIFTDLFELERGNAQGDTLSPFLFNLGYQILLFKLAYDQQIAGLIEQVELPRDFPPLPENISQVPPKVYALADDATVLTRMDPASLRRIREILVSFHELSGLSCNVEKTTLLQLGSTEPVPREILELGFDVQDKVTLLGLKIDVNCSNFTESKNDIEGKINSQIRFWQRFNLSLPGRISVAKTFLYSQLNYLGCFLPFEPVRLNNIENLIETYVKGPLNISKERMTLPRGEGGLGLFKLETFLGSQCCTWAKRAQSLDDNWKLRLYAKSLGNTLNIRERFYNPVEEPILYSIAKNMEKFHASLTVVKENIKNACIVLNPGIMYGGENRRMLNEEFFGPEFFMENRYSLGRLTTKDILMENGRAIPHGEFIRKYGINLEEDKYNVLARACVEAVESGTKVDKIEKTCVDLTTFCNRFKKGSRPFRRILEGGIRDEIPRNMVTFSEKTETLIGKEMSTHLNNLWGYSYWSNDMRVFLFKMHSNILGLNNRVAHFVPDHSPICTFCRILLRNDAADEDTLHLFFNCPSTEFIRDEFFRWAFRENNQFHIHRKELFLIHTQLGKVTSVTIIKTVISKIFLKFIWDCRNRYCLPSLESAKENLKATLNTIISVSIKMREHFNDSGLAHILRQE